MSRDVRVRVTVAEDMPDGGLSLLVRVSPEHAAALTRDDFIGAATLTLPEGPR